MIRYDVALVCPNFIEGFELVEGTSSAQLGLGATTSQDKKLADFSEKS